MDCIMMVPLGVLRSMEQKKTPILCVHSLVCTTLTFTISYNDSTTTKTGMMSLLFQIVIFNVTLVVSFGRKASVIGKTVRPL